MLLTIPRIIPPDFLHALNLMGHTDEVVIADSNFPGHAIARHTAWQVPIFAPGVGVPEMLSAVLQLIPLDYAMKQSLIGMLAPPEQGPQPIHDRFGQVLKDSGYAGDELLMLPKPEFYERAHKAFCVLVTGEQARFANIIVRKGVIK